MCGRATLVSPGAVIREVFRLDETPVLQPRFNLAPLQPIPIIHTPGKLELVTWGERGPHPFINVKLERVTVKPAFRCLIVVDGFYEWRVLERRDARGKPPKQPFLFRRVDHEPFALGGVLRSGGKSAAIVTTTPSEMMLDIHDRQPVVLQREDWEPWLAGEKRHGSLDEMERVHVSNRVNDWRNDDPSCIEPVVPAQT
jgi:putative SOS response-associated peptidase YedK